MANLLLWDVFANYKVLEEGKTDKECKEAIKKYISNSNNRFPFACIFEITCGEEPFSFKHKGESGIETIYDTYIERN